MNLALPVAPTEAPVVFPVLLVEDNPLLRRIMEDLITAAGFPVTVAADGAAALEQLERRHHPIVVTDWVMPGMDGLELCRALRRRAAEHYTYILLVTAQGGREEMLAGLEAGADEYLVKPVNPAELSARLKIARRILALEQNLKRSLEAITRLSLRDPLTEAYNRRFLVERLPQEIKRAYRYQRPLSLVLLDLDHFKVVNDIHGHQAGDTVLRECVRLTQEGVRDDVDWLVRYGGEEFVVVLPETDHAGALIVAERLRARLAAHAVPWNGAGLRVTASFGVATLALFPEKRHHSLESLLEAADRCLYRAKEEGRNRVAGLQL
jgi:diguanylate cyclase (GGDEF)-like protein